MGAGRAVEVDTEVGGPSNPSVTGQSGQVTCPRFPVSLAAVVLEPVTLTLVGVLPQKEHLSRWLRRPGRPGHQGHSCLRVSGLCLLGVLVYSRCLASTVSNKAWRQFVCSPARAAWDLASGALSKWKGHPHPTLLSRGVVLLALLTDLPEASQLGGAGAPGRMHPTARLPSQWTVGWQ